MHQDIEILDKTFSCMTNNEFWEIVDRIPDLAFKRNLQIRKWAILAHNTGLPGYGSLGVQRVYFVKTVTWKIFLIFCLLALNLKMNGLLFGIFSRKKFQIPITSKNILLHFIENLDKPTTARFLLGGLSLPFDSRIADFLNKFVAVSIRKIYRIRQNMIREELSSDESPLQ